MRRCVRRLALYATIPMAVVGCGSRDHPAVGIAVSASFLNVSRLAIADATGEGAFSGVDTVLMSESTSLAGPAIQRARELVNVPGMIAVVGHSNSAASLAASQVYNEAEVVQLAPTSTAVLYSQAGPYSFRMVPPDDQQGRFLAGEVARRFPRGARVAVYYVNDDYGRGLRASVRSSLDAPFPIVLDIPHTELGEPDEVIRQAIQAARTARPDVVLWLGRASMLGEYLTGLRAAIGRTPIIAGDAVSSWSHAGNADGRWTGVQYVDFVDLDASPELRAFRQRYSEAFGTAAGGGDALTYDAVRLLLAAIADGATTGPAVRAWLQSLGRERPVYEGLSGPLSFTADGDVERPHLLLTVPPPDRTP